MVAALLGFLSLGRGQGQERARNEQQYDGDTEEFDGAVPSLDARRLARRL